MAWNSSFSGNIRLCLLHMTWPRFPTRASKESFPFIQRSGRFGPACFREKNSRPQSYWSRPIPTGTRIDFPLDFLYMFLMLWCFKIPIFSIVSDFIFNLKTIPQILGSPLFSTCWAKKNLKAIGGKIKHPETGCSLFRWTSLDQVRTQVICVSSNQTSIRR